MPCTPSWRPRASGWSNTATASGAGGLKKVSTAGGVSGSGGGVGIFKTVAAAASSLLVGLSLVSPVHGLKESQHMRMTPTSSPQWQPSSLIPFIIVLCITPIQIATLALIIRRRHRYPIAGRGWIFLLVLCSVSTVDVFLLMLLSLYFPHGVPCPVDYLIQITSILTLIAYIMRGIVLVFRMEVRNFLAERQWRLEKVNTIKKVKEEEEQRIADNADNNKTKAPMILAAAVSTGGGKNSNEVERLVPIPLSVTEDEVDLSPASMQGHFFIQNRWMTHPKALGAYACTILAYVITSLLAMVFLDPDVARQRRWREANGLPPDPEDYGSQFLQGHFLNSPPCIVGCAKTYTVLAVYAVVVPLGFWAVSRLWLNSQRARNRSKERQDFQRRVQQASGGGGDSDTPYAIPAAFASDDLDDSRLVKNEFLMCIGFAIAVAVLPMFNSSYGPEWSCLIKLLGHAAYWVISIVLPLVRSETISRRHRQAMVESRSGSNNKGGTDTAGGAKGRKKAGLAYVGAALPHQRPYFSTKFILHNAHTYPVLLKFLRKEYSSENALFYTEVRELKALCVQLERAMPSWPQGRDDDRLGSHFVSDGSSAGGAGGGGVGVSGIGGGALGNQVANGGGGGVDDSRVFPTSVVDGRVRNSGADLTLPPRPASLLLVPSLSPSRPILPALSNGGGGGGGMTESVPGDNRVTFTLPLPPLSPSNGGSSSGGAAGSVATAASDQTAISATSPSNTNAVKIISAVDQAAAAARFKALHADAHRAKEWCLRIHAEFLAKSAIFEINIPDDLSALVTSQINQLRRYEPTPLDANGAPRVELTTTEEPRPPPFTLSLLFAAAQLTILNLVETDSFRRFILTAEFRALLAAADDAEVKRRETQADLQGDMAAALHEATNALNLHPSASAVAAAAVAGSSAAPSTGATGVSLVAPAPMLVPSRATPSFSAKKPSQQLLSAVSRIEMLPGAVQSP